VVVVVGTVVVVVVVVVGVVVAVLVVVVVETVVGVVEAVVVGVDGVVVAVAVLVGVGDVTDVALGVDVVVSAESAPSLPAPLQPTANTISSNSHRSKRMLTPLGGWSMPVLGGRVQPAWMSAQLVLLQAIAQRISGDPEQPGCG
jgi:hypothetical protein